MKKLESLIAHRGASPYAPENTFAAFDKARELGSRAVEFDVMMSADGELFVFHDDTFDRTTNGTGVFSEASSDYILSLDAGSWFSERFANEKIPRLSETLVWFATHEMQANIELKPAAGRAESMTTAFLACLNQYWPGGVSLPLVSCFDEAVLQLCVKLAPELPLGLLLEKWHTKWWEIAERVQAFSVHCDKRFMMPKHIRAIKQLGYQVGVYTVNSKTWANRYFKWGADLVLSDYPDLMNT